MLSLIRYIKLKIDNETPKRRKRVIGSVNDPCNKRRIRREKVITHARTAFISIIDIVFPMHACGPAINESIEKVG